MNPSREVTIASRTALLAGVVLAACSGGGSGGGSPAATFSVSPRTIQYTVPGPSSAAPTPELLTATVSGSLSGTLYVFITVSDPTVATVGGLFQTGPSTAQAAVGPAVPATLGIGVFRTTITIRACLNDATCATGELSGSPQIVNVTYTIPGLMTSAASLSYTIGNTAAPVDRSRTLQVTGAPLQAWTARSDVPWLAVAPGGGSTSAAVDLSATLVDAEVAAMTNGTHRGNVTLTPATGLPVVVPVTLLVGRTQVNLVAPYLAYSGTSDAVVIRGENLSQITVQDVKFGVESAASFTVVSDTEVRATHPALSAGAYPVALQNPEGFGTSLARLVVVDRPTFTATTLAYPVAFNALDGFGFAYDAERSALVVTRRDASAALVRYVYAGGTWSAPEEVEVPGVTSVALSADGTEWYAGTIAVSSGGVTTKAGIVRVRASDLLVGATAQSSISPGSGTYLDALVPVNDGSVIVLPSGLSFPLRFTPRDSVFASFGAESSFGGAGASADGSCAVIGSSIGDQVQVYDAGAGTVSTAAVDFSPVLRMPPSFDRTCTRFILNSGNGNLGFGLARVFDRASLAALGDLPATTIAAVLSPDGSRAYALDLSGTLRTFDLSATPPGAGTLLPEVGAGTALAGSPGAPSTSVGQSIRMTISPDGGTVFLAGSDRIVVQPVP